VTSHIVCAAARGIVMSIDRTILLEFGGHISLNRHWAHSFKLVWALFNGL